MSEQIQIIFVYIVHALQQKSVTFNVIPPNLSQNLSNTISKMKSDPVFNTGIFYSVYAALLW